MNTAPCQDYRDLEKLGFLCRWGLLAVAGCIMLGGLWACVSGTVNISSDMRKQLLMPDQVWRQGARGAGLYAYIDQGELKSDTPLTSFQDHLGKLRFAATNREHQMLIPSLLSPPAGKHSVTIRGLPYGSMAFIEHKTATVRVVPGPMTVYLLDARLLARIAGNDKQNDKQNALRITKELSRLGLPVLIFRGQRETIAELTGELGEFEDIRRVYSLQEDQRDLPELVNMLTRRLRGPKGSRSRNLKPYVITDDAETAVETAAQGNYVHLVASDRPPSSRPPNLRLHATYADLADHMANERPAHLPIP